jgi:PAS domain S-box-containing protein
VVVSVPLSRGRGGAELAGLRDVFDNLLAAVVYLAGEDLVVEFANDEFRQLLGGREVLGRPVCDAIPELAGQGLLDMLRTVLKSGQAVRGHEAEFWLRRHGSTAEQVFLDYVCQPLPGAGRGNAGVLLLAADVTGTVRDRRGAAALAAQLTATQDRYRTLFDTMPDGIIYYSADGLILGANPAARQILILPAESMLTWPLSFAWQSVRPDGTAFQPDEIPVAVALRTGQVVSDVVMGIPRGPTGELQWLGVTAVPDAIDEDGRPQRAYAIFRDLTRQRQTEAALREGHALMGRLREANVLGVVLVGEDQVHDANDAFLDLIGHSRADLEAGRLSRQGLTPPEWAPRDADALQQLRRAGAFRTYEKEYLHADGHRVPVLVGGAVTGRRPLRWITYVVDLTARQRAEQERATLLTRERAARAEAEGTQQRLDFLMQAGHLVAAARDRYELLQQASQLVVPGLADFCIGFLPERDGQLRGATIVHRDPARAVHAADLRHYPVPMVGQRAIQAACAAGASQVIHNAAARMLARDDLLPPVRSTVTWLQPETVLVTPLMAGPQALGVLALGRGPDRPPFTQADIDVIEGLGRQMAVGLANADKFARDHSVAETLQRAVLPDRLPEIAGLDLAVRYLPGTYGVEIGGDWYDAFPLGDGRVGLAIGDVLGHNITSASVMGQVRNLLRAYAVEADDPAEVLRRTGAALAGLLPEAMVTAAYAVLDPATGELSYANAGHPPPVCASATGRADYLDGAAGTMLGVPGGEPFSTGHWRLTAGSCLLFYTDGLIEARHRDISEGFATLASAMRGAGSRTAEQACATVTDALLGSTPRADDVCLLAVRPVSGPGAEAPAG